ncbi:MAG: hypothetical protein PCALPYG88_6835 [uncultured Paraburkholderia sp.]|nr:MAG: hypothetical protein PCALPYG08_6826 [uncultured Paraburkholderia sp.]CAH2940910.1 MAG: hypothetical protein PCALPYG88_6835 [uncultured Paraburkholderia sp.]
MRKKCNRQEPSLGVIVIASMTRPHSRVRAGRDMHGWLAPLLFCGAVDVLRAARSMSSTVLPRNGLRLFPERRSKSMSDLVVVSFKGEETADQVLTKLQQMQKEHLIDLEDACVLVRSANGKVHLKQAVDLVKIGALSGAAWGGLFGALVGLMLLNPLAGLATGMAIGVGTGALSGALSDYGIDDDFMRSTGQNIEPGSSALFILVRQVNFDKVLPELKPFGGKVLKTSLTNDQEERLKKALESLNSSGTTA